MICPYCYEEMEQGFIPSYEDTLHWYPENPGAPIFEERKVKLSKRNGSSIAHYCKSCGKIVIDISEQDTRSALVAAVAKTKEVYQEAYQWYQKKKTAKTTEDS